VGVGAPFGAQLGVVAEVPLPALPLQLSLPRVGRELGVTLDLESQRIDLAHGLALRRTLNSRLLEQIQQMLTYSPNKQTKQKLETNNKQK
jgi:hypothetical protein